MFHYQMKIGICIHVTASYIGVSPLYVHVYINFSVLREMPNSTLTSMAVMYITSLVSRLFCVHACNYCK